MPAAAPRMTPRPSSWGTGRNNTERAGAGAAVGTGFKALALLKPEIGLDIELILDLIGVDRGIVAADLVVTGEGSAMDRSMATDDQSACAQASTSSADDGSPSASAGRPGDVDHVRIRFLRCRPWRTRR
jgi:Glycerate kinase family